MSQYRGLMEETLQKVYVTTFKEVGLLMRGEETIGALCNLTNYVLGDATAA